MPENDNPVVDALQRGLALAFQAQQLKQSREEHQQELDFRKQQQVDAKAQQDLVNKASEKQQALLQAQFEHNMAQQNLNDAQIYQKTGITPTNASVIPGITPTASQPLVLSGAENSRVTFLNPTGTAQTVSVPPLAQSPEQLEVQRQQRELENREYLKQVDMMNRQLAVNTLTQTEEGKRALALADKNHQYRLDEEDARMKGEKELANIRGANELAVAKLKLGDPDQYANIPGFSDVLTRGRIGTLSQEDVNKSPFKKQLSAAALNQGFQFLPKAQTDKIQAIETMTNILPDIRQQLQLRQDHPIEVNNPLTKIGQDYAALSQRIKAAAPQASVAISGVRRLTQQELDRFDEFFIPNKGIFTSDPMANLNKYNSFVNDMRTTLGQTTKGLPQSQVNDIVSNLKGQGAGYLNLNTVQGDTLPQNPSGQNLIQWTVDPKTGMLIQQGALPQPQQPQQDQTQRQGFIYK